MTWIHAVKRQGVIAMLSIGLTIPAVGLAGAALAQGQGQGKAASNAASANAKAHADNGNGNGKKSEEAGSSSSSSDAASVDSASASSNSAGSSASTSQTTDTPAGCPNTFHNNSNGNGANVSGAYDSTCDGSPSANGNGNGNAGGKPCAGCVGNADDKNPPGQKPDGSDHNNGYECDGNHGVGKTNPAHSGCTPGTTVNKCPDGSPMTDVNHDGKVNADDCKTTHVDTCPDGSPMTDANHDGKVNSDDCGNGHVDCPASVQTAADHGKANGKDKDKSNNGQAKGKDKGNNGNDNGNNGNHGNGNNGNHGNGNNGNGNGNGNGNVTDKDCGHTTVDTCPDGSPMTDVNHDGKVNADDCTTNVVVINHGNPPQVLGLVVTNPATAVDAASAAKPASLPFTGSNAVNMALIADLILLAGTLAIWASGYRRQAHEVQG